MMIFLLVGIQSPYWIHQNEYAYVVELHLILTLTIMYTLRTKFITSLYKALTVNIDKNHHPSTLVIFKCIPSFGFVVTAPAI